MTGASQSREMLAMEMNQSANSVSFGKKNGCYINRSVAFLLVVLFISATVATGLLVYYYAPAHREASQQNVQQSSKPLTNPNAELITTTLAPTTTTTTTTTTTEATTTTTMKPKEEEEEELYVRLPRSLKPLHYKVRLQPFINGNFTIFGYVEIEMEVLMPTNNITLHINTIKTKNDTIQLEGLGAASSDTSLGIDRHVYDDKRQFYVAHLNNPLEAGQRYKISMEFEGYLNDDLNGFYRSQYKDAEGKTRWLATTQFQPTDARKAFPCFDEPALKASFEIILGRQENMTAISNMPRVETTPIEGQPGWFWDHFNTTVPMSTYLLAFVVSDFAYRNSSDSTNALFRVWAREDAIDQAEYAREKGPQVLNFFTDYFNVPYPLPKQDMIAVPDFSAGAMENWGLITYRETALLYDPEVSAASNLQRVSIVIAHELAHQWFGNLVTPSWWTDLWLNEGFASFLEYLGVDAVEKSWQMKEQFVIMDVQSVFRLDCLESSHPISIPVKNPDQINEIFDRISYSKGASIIRMMNHFLTEPSFRKGLARYLTVMKYDSAEQDDLWRYLTQAAHDDGTLPADLTAKTIMDTWTLQMGYPVVTVKVNDDGTAKVTQERFLLVRNENSTDTHDYKWWVPLSFTSEDNPNFTDTSAAAWIPGTADTTVSGMPSADKWVIFNLQQTGYYRVNYEERNWNLLIKQLMTDHTVINVINRAQLIDDVLNLAKAGIVPYETALEINGYLSKETEYVPWSSALSNMGYIDSMLSRTGAYGALKDYLLSLLIPLYDSVGFDDNINDPHLDQFKRVKAVSWACSLDHEPCIYNAKKLFKMWMENPNNSSISPNLKSVVYCTAIKHGDKEEWDFAWNQYQASNVGSEKAKLLSAMGCTKKIWLLSRYLDIAFTPNLGVRKQDASSVFRSVAYNSVGRYLAWDYLRDQWERITDYFGMFKSLGDVIEAASNDFNTKLERKELIQFRDEHKDKLGTAKRAIEQAIERTSNNIAWKDANHATIEKWLTDNGFSSSLNVI
ncbi:aminopeptidase N-like isoform X3 [Oratosquilla oratoria]|uniref:aminopeptidase N-like isoform X3 n=1 Tax=Oratosquilla oratoria TaxID=337810 RepID=UPI003F7780B3